MTIEIHDPDMIQALWNHYEAPMRALMVSSRTGGSIDLPVDWDTRGQLLSFALHDPQVAFVWGKELAYSQLDLWQPYIAASRRRFVTLSRALKKEGPVAKMPTTPSYTAKTGFKVGTFVNVAPSLKTFIYVTDKNENFGYLRSFPKGIHVCGHHGDSDKHSSFSRLPSAYDFVLVADENSMARYIRAGIQISTDRMIPIGNTVIKGVKAADQKATFTKALYAPTFEGYSEQANFSSLLRAGPQIAAWRQADGGDVVFRPHPGFGKRSMAYKDAAVQFPRSMVQQTLKSKAKQYNWSDFIIADISGVVSEYVFTGKPIIIPIARSHQWLHSYVASLSIGKYAYIWDYEAQSLDAFIATIAHDPLREARLSRRTSLYAGVTDFKGSSELFENALSYFDHCHRFREIRHGNHPAPSQRRSLKAYPGPEGEAERAMVARLASGEVTLRA
ncbi:CDP-glycerol glycerophosphotransferase family protein [Brevundimonas sp.]|uniref:CDP-glycerol glycerophosphotransferase family protein n=1 Tax=Brevundimonas sp. TaxID=1871086 RepID=UPI003BAA66EC